MDRRGFIKFMTTMLASLGLPVLVVGNEPLPECTSAPLAEHKPLTVDAWKAAAEAFKKLPPLRGYWPMPEQGRSGYIFYINRRTGDDANDGLSPERALLTEEHALSLCSEGELSKQLWIRAGDGTIIDSFDDGRWQNLEHGENAITVRGAGKYEPT